MKSRFSKLGHIIIGGEAMADRAGPLAVDKAILEARFAGGERVCVLLKLRGARDEGGIPGKFHPAHDIQLSADRPTPHQGPQQEPALAATDRRECRVAECA